MNWQAITPPALAALALAIWCYLIGFRGFFWRVTANLLPPQPTPGRSYRVVVVIPARDEAEGIGMAVGSLLGQDFPGTVEVVVVDDHSSDATAQLAHEAARRSGDRSRLTVLEGRKLPPGWSGKLWAVQQGLDHVLGRPTEPDFILLTDADICHAPTSLRELVAQADSGPYDLTSLMVRLSCDSPAERWLVPAFVFFFFMIYPPRWVQRRPQMAAAAGGCMLVRAPALRAAGGMNPIRGEIIDDCALAALIKRKGGSVYLGLASHTSSLRRYESPAEIGAMIARTAFNQLGHSFWLLLATLMGLVATYLVPVGALVWGVLAGRPAVAGRGIAACLLMGAAYYPMVRFYGLGTRWVATLPLAAVFYSGATVLSALRYWSGRGGQWKGRAQDRMPGAQHFGAER